MMKRNLFILGFSIFLAFQTAQSEQDAPFQPVKLIDIPTAGAIAKGRYMLDFKFFGDGGISTAIGAGITNRFSFGIAYQLMRFIGGDDIAGQSFPGIFVKYRLMEESYYMPGLALGFDSQGDGPFYRKRDGDQYPRFYFKSKGFYAALSKSYLFLGQPLGLHYEINYSIIDNQAVSEAATEDGRPTNRIINMGIGLDKSINDEISLLAEYDIALDDNHRRDPLKGYLHAGVRWALVRNFALEVDLKDILGNKRMNGDNQSLNREVRIVYSDKF